MTKQIFLIAALSCLLAGCYSSDAERTKPKAERKLHSAKSPLARMARADTLVTRNSTVIGALSDPARRRVLQVEAVRYEYPDPKTRKPSNFATVQLTWCNAPDAQVDVTLDELPPLLEALESMAGAPQSQAGLPNQKRTYKTTGGLFVSVSQTPAARTCLITFEQTSLATTPEGLQQLRDYLVKAREKLASL